MTRKPITFLQFCFVVSAAFLLLAGCGGKEARAQSIAWTIYCDCDFDGANDWHTSGYIRTESCSSACQFTCRQLFAGEARCGGGPGCDGDWVVEPDTYNEMARQVYATITREYGECRKRACEVLYRDCIKRQYLDCRVAPHWKRIFCWLFEPTWGYPSPRCPEYLSHCTFTYFPAGFDRSENLLEFGTFDSLVDLFAHLSKTGTLQSCVSQF